MASTTKPITTANQTRRYLYASLIMAVLAMAPTRVASPVQGAALAIVTSSDAQPYLQAQKALKNYLTQQGHSVSVVRLEEFPKQIAGLKKDTSLFVGVGTPAAVALQREIHQTEKITYCMVADPNKAGLRGDKPVHGLSVNAPLDAQFVLIKQGLPQARRLGMLYHAKTAEGKKLLKDVQTQLPKGWHLEAVSVDDYKTPAQAMDALFSRPVDVIWTYPDGTIFNKATIRTMLLASIRSKVPVFGFSRAFVKAGALLGLSVSPKLQGQHIGHMIHEMLTTGQWSPTSDNNSQTFEIVLNEIVAQQIEHNLPDALRKQARLTIKSEKSK